MSEKSHIACSNTADMPDSHLWEIVRSYLVIKESVIDRGFANEIDWQNRQAIDTLTESAFLCEAAWVILSSGMRERTIRKKFDLISGAFFDWKSAKKISRRADHCRRSALEHFNHVPKINAILSMSAHVSKYGFDSVVENIKENGVEFISQFPYMGPATSFHLAKNIGLSFAKPDRHLVRIANAVGYSSPNNLCSDISELVGDKIAVVDLVLWRYATLFDNYLAIFPDPGNPKIDWEDCGFCWLH